VTAVSNKYSFGISVNGVSMYVCEGCEAICIALTWPALLLAGGLLIYCVALCGIYISNSWLLIDVVVAFTAHGIVSFLHL
jgi:hypothetical protein